MLENAVSLRCAILYKQSNFILPDHHLEMKFQAKSHVIKTQEYKAILRWNSRLLKLNSDPFAGDLFMATNNLPYYSLENALNNLFSDSQLNYWLSIATLLQFLRLLKGT